MYGWIWRQLPGDTMTKAVWAVGLIAAVAGLLWFLVFPWVEPRVRFDHGTVENSGTADNSGTVRNGVTPSPRR